MEQYVVVINLSHEYLIGYIDLCPTFVPIFLLLYPIPILLEQLLSALTTLWCHIDCIESRAFGEVELTPSATYLLYLKIKSRGCKGSTPHS